MRQAMFFPVIVFFAAQVAIGVARLDFAPNKYVNRVNEALRPVFPQNIVKTYASDKFDNLARANATTCSEQVQLLGDALQNGTAWALKMIDASSKLPSGILTGNLIDLGMYDECIGIRAEDKDGAEIRGRHCMYQAVVTSDEMKAIEGMEGIEIGETLSLCFPASCEAQEIQIILNRTVELIKFTSGMDIPIKIKGVTCASLATPEWTAGGIATLVGFSLLLLFLVVSTICDAIQIYFKETLSTNSKLALISKFSIYSNAIRILSTKSSPETMSVIQGLRFFSMTWVVLGHEYSMAIVAPTVNKLEVLEWVNSWDSLYIMNGPFAVDTFFTISGFLISYLFLKEMATGRGFNIFGYYIHRYLRLTPAYAAMILMTLFFIPRLGSGALWESIWPMFTTSCQNKWWSMLLYVHNYVDKDDLFCLPHTWYLAVEMQYFVISPLIVYPLAKKPKIGLIILGMFFIASVVTPTVIAYVNEYPTAFEPRDLGRSQNSMTNFYMLSHIRAAPWVIGVFFGYLVFTQKGSTRKTIKWIGWLLAIGAFCFCIFSFRKFQEEGYLYDSVWETFYAAVARPLWAFCISWIIYASVRGFGGPIAAILSFSIFNPFSRISYCIYLVHFMIQLMKLTSSRVPLYFSDFIVFNNFLSDFMLSIVVGLAWSLLFESPILVLEKIVKNRGKRRGSKSKEDLMAEDVVTGIDSRQMAVN